jgi:hypothetical protein
VLLAPHLLPKAFVDDLPAGIGPFQFSFLGRKDAFTQFTQVAPDYSQTSKQVARERAVSATTARRGRSKWKKK